MLPILLVITIYTYVLIAIVIVVALTYTVVYLDLLLYQINRLYLGFGIIEFCISISTNIYSYNCYNIMQYFTLFHHYNYTFLIFYINFQRILYIFNYFIWRIIPLGSSFEMSNRNNGGA